MSDRRSGRSHTRYVPADRRPLSVLISARAVTGIALYVVVGAPNAAQLPQVPSAGTLEVLLRSPNAPLDGLLKLASLFAWAIWAWIVASVAVESVLALVDRGSANGATLAPTLRKLINRLTFPMARRAVGAA